MKLSGHGGQEHPNYGPKGPTMLLRSSRSVARVSSKHVNNILKPASACEKLSDKTKKHASPFKLPSSQSGCGEATSLMHNFLWALLVEKDSLPLWPL
ncbi:hypothetical protein K1719_042703 [Acacia pycnantha]|nr:hypothetical protein K1719_042703 [Acacia pycnantha]